MPQKERFFSSGDMKYFALLNKRVIFDENIDNYEITQR